MPIMEDDHVRGYLPNGPSSTMGVNTESDTYTSATSGHHLVFDYRKVALCFRSKADSA